MDPSQALELFGLSDGSSIAELNGAYDQKASDLSYKIETAASPVLKEKFEAALRELEEARTTLFGFAADVETEQPETEPAPVSHLNRMTTSQVYDLPTVSMFDARPAAHAAAAPADATWTPPPTDSTWTPPASKTTWTPPPPARISGFTASMIADLPSTGSILPAGPGGGLPAGLIPTAGLMVGEPVAGRYHVRGELGRGGMGVVYAAFDVLKQQEIALKVLLPHLLANESARERFVNEAKIAVSLSHPFIIKVYDIQQDSGRTFITMEKLEGQSLRHEIDDCIKGAYKIPVNIVLGVADELCDALQYAHSLTVHRDLKPENIWLRDNGSCLIMDFGLARLITHSNMTMSNAALGTPLYMAPEQRSDSKNVDGRADQYAVALVLYELLAGEVPQGNFQSPRDIRKDVPAGMSAAIMRALSNSPEKRYNNMAAFKNGLRQSSWGNHGTGEKIALIAGVLALIAGIAYFFAVFEPDQAAHARMLESMSGSELPDTSPLPKTEASTALTEEVKGGGLVITTVPSKAQVMLGGQSVQDSPAKFTNLSPGTYHIQISLHRYETIETDMEVQQGQFTSQDFTLQPQAAYRMTADPATYYQQILDQAGTADASAGAGQIDEARKEWSQVLDCLSFLQETHPEWQSQLVKDRKAEFQHRLDLLQ